MRSKKYWSEICDTFKAPASQPSLGFVIPEAALRPRPILGFTTQPRGCRCGGPRRAGEHLAKPLRLDRFPYVADHNAGSKGVHELETERSEQMK